MYLFHFVHLIMKYGVFVFVSIVYTQRCMSWIVKIWIINKKTKIVLIIFSKAR